MQATLLLMLVLSFLIAGCAGGEPAHTVMAPIAATMTATSTPLKISAPTRTPSARSTPTATPTATSTQMATEVPPDQQLKCGESFCQSAWPGILIRPISGEYRNTIDPIYPYASTKGGTLDAHHGVEFPNAFGTPVLAAAEGEVIFAGTDDLTLLGPYTGFFGNVVILRHAGLYQGRDLFSLYAHLSEINVEEGMLLSVGEVLGKVGASGAADGSHLHFEVRIDDNANGRTLNPVLWFSPVQEQAGVQSAMLAGQILDRFGMPLPEFEFVLEKRVDSARPA